MELLRDEESRSLVQAVVSEQQSTVTKFVSLLLKEEEKQAEDAKKGVDVLVNDVQCKK